MKANNEGKATASGKLCGPECKHWRNVRKWHFGNFFRQHRLFLSSNAPKRANDLFRMILKNERCFHSRISILDWLLTSKTLEKQAPRRGELDYSMCFKSNSSKNVEQHLCLKVLSRLKRKWRFYVGTVCFNLANFSSMKITSVIMEPAPS